MDSPLLLVRRGLGLSPTGARPDSRLAASPSTEKGNKALEGASSLYVVGNLEGDEQSSGECFSCARLKSCFLRSICSWSSLIHDVEHSFVRGILFIF